MANIWKIAGIALSIGGGILGMAADYADSKNRTEEAREEARAAARDEIQRMYADDHNDEEEV